MILDEITAFLDLPRRVEIRQMLRDLARTTNKAILLSTHDLDLALRSADVIWLLPKGGAMQIGVPEDLVLDGTFASAFASEGIVFDSEMGAFRITQQHNQEVALTGAGETLRWTKRALERKGFLVIEAQPETRYPLQISATQSTWQLTTAQGTAPYHSLQEVLAKLTTR